MAKNSVDQWSTTAGNNTDVGGINIAEGCAAANINNALREIMKQFADLYPNIGRLDEAETASGNWTVSGDWIFTGSLDFSGVGNASTIRTDIGLAIGTDVQAYDADLAAIAGLTSAANKVPYFTGSGTAGVLDFLDEDNMASDSATAVPSQQSVKAYVDGSSVFTESYTSAGQTITSGGSLTLAHGLASAPAFIQIRLKCTSTDGGYSVNDEVIIAAGNGANGSNNRGVSVVPDATNINIRYGSNGDVFAVNNKTTGAVASLTNANWEMIVRAWA